MDRYQRVEKPRPESAINEKEIRITSQGQIRNYINYAISIFQNNLEKHSTEIVLKAMGQAISKAVAIAEILKKRIPGLHQDTIISSVSITDVWEPTEEGLVPLEMTRNVSMISISLSIRILNKNSPGYQPPLHLEQPKQPKYQQPRYYNQRLPPRQSPLQYDDGSFGQGRGQGRGRGRGGGWGRGGYNEHGGYEGYNGYSGYADNWGYPINQGYANQENGGWNNNGWGRGGGRGGGPSRGRGGWGYYVTGYERGGGGGGKGYGRGRGREGGRRRGNQFF